MKDPHKKIIGRIGEDIATEYLKNKGFEIVERNFSIRYGELDIVAKKDKKLFFVEVKTFALKNGEGELLHRPEENVHPGKLKSLAKTVQSYLSRFEDIPEWKFLVVSIRLDQENKIAKVKMIEDVL